MPPMYAPQVGIYPWDAQQRMGFSVEPMRNTAAWRTAVVCEYCGRAYGDVQPEGDCKGCGAHAYRRKVMK